MIDEYTYISFDIFDTLIKRNVLKPIDIFNIVEKRYNRQYKIKIDDFVIQRVRAEKNLRDAIKQEVKLSEIYERLSDVYGYDVTEKLKKIECQTEIDFCCPNQDILKIYNRCLKSKKKILIITDMYLDKETICRMLDKCGYHYYNQLYISSEVGKTKESGKLFSMIKEELQIEGSKWLHIGDNRKSDYIKAKKAGIKAKHIPTFKNRMKYFKVERSNDLGESVLSAMMNNSIEENISLWERFGFECLGPVLIGFVNWLVQELRAQGIKKVFFLSRDGFIIQKIYDLAQVEDIEAYYLYASRRALQVPAFYVESDYEQVVSSFFLPRTLKFEVFIKKLGLDYEQIIESANKYGYTKSTLIRFEGIKENRKLKMFYEDVKYQVLENARIEYEALINYLKQNCFKGRVAIVDIGWFGNMQAALDKLVKHAGINVELYGYYMGLIPEGDIQDKLNMKGYLFSKTHHQEVHPKERIFNSVFETLFLGNHGSVKKYYINNEYAGVELYPYECEDSDMEQQIREIQKGATTLAKYWYGIEDNVELEISPEFAFATLCEIGVSPNNELAQKIGDWKFFDMENCYIAKPDYWIEYLKKPKLFIRDLNRAPWKVGFLKRIFKVKLPYYNIWMQIRNIYKKGEKNNG